MSDITAMQDSHSTKCQAVFSTLLSMQILYKTMPQAFVRELFHETVRCDDVLDMSNGLGWRSQLYHRLVQPVEGVLHAMLHK